VGRIKKHDWGVHPGPLLSRTVTLIPCTLACETMHTPPCDPADTVPPRSTKLLAAFPIMTHTLTLEENEQLSAVT